MVEDITSVDFPAPPEKMEEDYDLPKRDPHYSLLGYRRWESTIFYRPLCYVWYTYLQGYGWYLLGALIASLYLYHKLRPLYYRWRQAREDAAYHKDPDRILQHLEGTQRAREIQQELLLEESQRATEAEMQREQRLRLERAQFLDRLENGSGAAWRKNKVDNYLPLSDAGSISSYRRPKLSPCADGGCGR
ncbi:selenoprotein S (SelS) domain-containing protein [Phthorimaea operculella]|nr:selenoprotein S (SelS) domain-containing protein [Phthorimaea operculella]